jgi:hypothetical protein
VAQSKIIKLVFKLRRAARWEWFLVARSTRVLIAIADVGALVPAACPIDNHARNNTTSVYTAATIFPMPPVP